MSYFRSASADKLFSSVIFLALFLLFFIISLSAGPIAYIQLNIQLKKIDYQKIQLPQVNFDGVRSESTQFKISQSKQAKSNQGDWIQLKQGQSQEVQFKLNRTELSQFEQIKSQQKPEGQSQFKRAQSQQNQSLQTRTESTQSQPAQSQPTQSQQIQNDQSQSQQIQAEQAQTEQAQAQQTQRPSPGPKQAHFYNVDTERRIEGTIQEVILEPRYEERQPFLMIVIKEKKTGEIFKVEVSPAWFFNYDLHKGESIKIIGSFYSLNNENFLIAREIQVSGETFRVRDSRGFPNWRGGPMKGKIRRIRGK